MSASSSDLLANILEKLANKKEMSANKRGSLANKWDSKVRCPETLGRMPVTTANMMAIEDRVVTGYRETSANQESLVVVTSQASNFLLAKSHSHLIGQTGKSRPRSESFPFRDQVTKCFRKQEWHPDSKVSFGATFRSLRASQRFRRIYRHLN